MLNAQGRLDYRVFVFANVGDDSEYPGTRSCTADFKIRVVARWQRQHGATPANPAVTALGITLDEIGRARTDSGIPHQRLAYPLLDLGLRRADCPAIIRSAGLPMPPKSACWFCRKTSSRSSRDFEEIGRRLVGRLKAGIHAGR